jgi:hypothetical protein
VPCQTIHKDRHAISVPLHLGRDSLGRALNREVKILPRVAKGGDKNAGGQVGNIGEPRNIVLAKGIPCSPPLHPTSLAPGFEGFQPLQDPITLRPNKDDADHEETSFGILS